MCQRHLINSAATHGSIIFVLLNIATGVQTLPSIAHPILAGNGFQELQYLPSAPYMTGGVHQYRGQAAAAAAPRPVSPPGTDPDPTYLKPPADYSGILHAMKRQMSMLRLRRALNTRSQQGAELTRDLRSSPMNRMTMLRLRRYRQPSMLRLKRLTQFRLKKSDPELQGVQDESSNRQQQELYSPYPLDGGDYFTGEIPDVPTRV